MIDKLNELCADLNLSTKEPNNNSGRLFVIEDRLENQANFFISYLLDHYLRNQNGIVLVSTNQNYATYSSISKRLGLNIESQISSGNLTFLDCFTGNSDWITEEIPYTEEASNLWSFLPFKANRLTFKEGEEDITLKEMFDLIKSELANKKENRPTIIVDNITNLLNYGVSEMALLTFINMLYNLAKASEKQPTIFIGYTPEIANESQSKVCNLLKMNYDILFEVYPNPSGFSKEVSGQFKVSIVKEKSTRVHSLKYKLEMNKVNLFEYLNQ